MSKETPGCIAAVINLILFICYMLTAGLLFVLLLGLILDKELLPINNNRGVGITMYAIAMLCVSGSAARAAIRSHKGAEEM